MDTAPSDRVRRRRVVSSWGRPAATSTTSTSSIATIPRVEVVAFTAAQIPGIAGRRYPPALAGPHYPDGIAIEDEAELEALCRAHAVDEVVFAYSDVPHAHVMHAASRALAAGADFVLLGPRPHHVAVVAAGASRSPRCAPAAASRRSRAVRVAPAAAARSARRRAPPPDALRRSRSASACSASPPRADLDAARCTVEEREEYEPHIAAGNVVLRRRRLRARSCGGRDGGRRHRLGRRQQRFPVPAARPAHRRGRCAAPGQVATHHPGETVLRMADVVVVNKVDVAPRRPTSRRSRAELRAVNPDGDHRARRLAGRARRSRRRARAGACSWSRTGPPSPTAACRTAPATSRRMAAGAAIVDPRARADPAMRAGVRSVSAHRQGAAGGRLRRRAARRAEARPSTRRHRRRGRGHADRSRARCCNSTSPWCGRATSSPRPASPEARLARSSTLSSRARAAGAAR